MISAGSTPENTAVPRKFQVDLDLASQVYDSFYSILELRQEWDAFVESVKGDIYLTFDWCRIWWELYGAKRYLRIYLFWSGRDLAGIVPIFYETLWLGPVWLRVAKVVGSDFTLSMANIPVRMEFADCIFHSVIESLIEVEKCEAICLGPISGVYAALEPLRKIAEEHPSTVFQEYERGLHTLFSLPQTFEAYLQSLDKRQRGNTRRDLNLLSKSFVMTQDVIAGPERVDLEIKNFIDMHTEQWQAEGKLGHFQDWPAAEKFHCQMALEQAKRGRLRLVRLLANGIVVSYQLCYAVGERWYWRLPARRVGPEWDKYALGRIGLIKEIETAITEGVMEIDGGAGHYEYKVKLGGVEQPLCSIRLVKNRKFCRLRAWLFALFSTLLDFGYYRIWFKRLAPKIPFKRRPLWSLWIRTRL